jgi:hypothetical protein
MKRIICVISLLLLVLNLSAQTLHVVVGNTTYMFPATQAGEMNYTDGSTLTIVDKSFTLADVSRIYVDDSEVTDNTVQVSYSGSSASVKVSGNIAKYIVPTISGAHVKLVQSEEVDDNVGEITYNLTGTSADGEFYMEGSYKATIELDGITLTNVTPVYSGAAVHIQNGKRINVKVITGTENTLVDAASGSQKGALYIKGHAEFKQKGTLNVTGNLKHAIKTGEYFSLKNATINVLGAAGGDVGSAVVVQRSAVNQAAQRGGNVVAANLIAHGRSQFRTGDDGTGINQHVQAGVRNPVHVRPEHFCIEILGIKGTRHSSIILSFCLSVSQKWV